MISDVNSLLMSTILFTVIANDVMLYNAIVFSNIVDIIATDINNKLTRLQWYWSASLLCPAWLLKQK